MKSFSLTANKTFFRSRLLIIYFSFLFFSEEESPASLIKKLESEGEGEKKSCLIMLLSVLRWKDRNLSSLLLTFPFFFSWVTFFDSFIFFLLAPFNFSYIQLWKQKDSKVFCFWQSKCSSFEINLILSCLRSANLLELKTRGEFNLKRN